MAYQNATELVKRKHEVVRRTASIEKAKKLLGHELKTDIKPVLSRVYKWILDNKDNIERSIG